MRHVDRIIFVSGAFVILWQGSAIAAAVKAVTPACRDEATLKSGLQNGDKEGKNAVSYFSTKINAGDCIRLLKGQEVSVDERHSEIWCVRRTGDLDCYWTLEKAVDLYPPIESKGGNGTRQSRSGGHRH